MVNEEDSDGRTYGTGYARGQSEITEALSPVGLWADMGHQCK